MQSTVKKLEYFQYFLHLLELLRQCKFYCWDYWDFNTFKVKYRLHFCSYPGTLRLFCFSFISVI